MADQIFLIHGSGFYKDTEQNDIVLVPGSGFYKEQEGVEEETLLPIIMNEINQFNGGSNII